MREGEKAKISPEPIMRLTTAYWESQVLLTANRIGLFDTLAQGPRDASAIARELGISPRGAVLLLNSCVALGLAMEGTDGYTNSPLSDEYLVAGKETYMGNAIRYSDNLYSAWGQLEQALREGRPSMPAEEYLGRDPAMTRDFVYGMHNRALGIGQALAEIVDLAGRRQMLDVGGGPGTYSALLTRRFPELRSRVMDLPEVVALAREILVSMGEEERVSTFPGDYKDTDFPGGNDVVLISGVFHREREAVCRDLIARAADSLTAGGMLIVSDVFTDAGGCAPAFATLFGLNMMLSAPDGGVHADADVADWMQAAGFLDVRIQHFPPPMPHRVVSGYKE